MPLLSQLSDIERGIAAVVEPRARDAHTRRQKEPAVGQPMGVRVDCFAGWLLSCTGERQAPPKKALLLVLARAADLDCDAVQIALADAGDAATTAGERKRGFGGKWGSWYRSRAEARSVRNVPVLALLDDLDGFERLQGFADDGTRAAGEPAGLCKTKGEVGEGSKIQAVREGGNHAPDDCVCRCLGDGRRTVATALDATVNLAESADADPTAQVEVSRQGSCAVCVNSKCKVTRRRSIQGKKAGRPRTATDVEPVFVVGCELAPVAGLHQVGPRGHVQLQLRER